MHILFISAGLFLHKINNVAKSMPRRYLIMFRPESSLRPKIRSCLITVFIVGCQNKKKITDGMMRDSMIMSCVPGVIDFLTWLWTQS